MTSRHKFSPNQTQINILRHMSGGASALGDAIAKSVGVEKRTARHGLQLLGQAGLMMKAPPQPGDYPRVRWAITRNGLAAIAEHRRQVAAQAAAAAEAKALTAAECKARRKAKTEAARDLKEAAEREAAKAAEATDLLSLMKRDAMECNLRCGFAPVPFYGKQRHRPKRIPGPKPLPHRVRLMDVLTEAGGETLTTAELSAATGVNREDVSSLLSQDYVAGRVIKGWGPRKTNGGRLRLWRASAEHLLAAQGFGAVSVHSNASATTGPHRGDGEEKTMRREAQQTCASTVPTSVSAAYVHGRTDSSVSVQK